MPPPRSSVPLALAALAALAAVAALAACGDDFGLPPATIANAELPLTLYAIDGTPISAPSGYALELRQPVRLDVSGFDFAFNIDGAARAVLLPTGYFGLGGQSGIKVVTVPFDSLKEAPGDPYERQAPVPIDVGTVLVVHSRPTFCAFGPFFAKLEVTAIDLAQRRATFRILVNENCGYRGLEPGLPKR